MIEELRDLGITWHSRWIFNCYVIHDGGAGRPVIVDLGIPGHLTPIAEDLRRVGADVRDVACVVATHGHADHVGGLPRLRREQHVPVALPRRIEAMLAGGSIRAPGTAQLARILPVMADQTFDLAAVRELGAAAKEIGYDSRAVRFPFTPEWWLSDGDVIPGAPDWQVIATPGHTDDSISLYRSSTRTLISGDAVLSVDGRGWFNPERVDDGDSAATENRLRALDVDQLLPGHGRVVIGAAAMRDAWSFADRPPDSGAVRSLVRIFRHHH